MASFQRPAPLKRNSMRPPPKPVPSATGRSQSPAESQSSGSASRPRSPSAPPNTGTKRKERDFEHDAGEETNIHVVVRCRGRSDREVCENSGVVVSTNGVKGKNVELSMGPNAISNKTYNFDKVFSPAADQTIIFEDVVTPILEEMLAGYNCTVFAYGQTGTGKTYTMSGDMADTYGLLSDAAGIIPRVLYWLFQRLETDGIECSVKCSFIELYNEELRDLLSSDETVKMKIYDDASKKGHGATMVQGMEESHIKTAAAGVKLLQDGSHRRQVAATKCNDLSSRSHTVFTITTFIKKSTGVGEDFICAGKLNLVDLAGSENIQRSGAENKRAAEAGLINKSLLTLGRVINALVDKSSHIPYRESKLTRLLQDSLGGHTKTCIIATVSPAKSNLEETISTLDYAFRAKNIRNKPQVNSMISKKTLLKEFTAEIEKLKSELIATRQRNGVYLSNSQYEDITVESESRRILSEEQKARIETMEISLRNKVQELFSLTNNFNTLKRDNEATRTLLNNTKDVLAQTEIVLRDTRQMLAEETAMREAHQKTEEELQKLGNGLISALGKSVKDLGGLHDGIQRRADLHTQNRQTWESSSSAIASLAEVVDAKIEEFRVEHSNQLAALSLRLEDFASGAIEKFKQNQEFLKGRTPEFEKSTSTLKDQTLAANEDMNNVLEEIKVLREEVKSQVGEGLSGLSAAAARISGEVIAELDEFHAQLHTSYRTLGQDFKSLFEGITKEFNAHEEEAASLRFQLQEANQKILDANTSATSQLELNLENERLASQLDRQNILSQITSLVEASATRQEERFSSAVRLTNSQLVEAKSVYQLANEQYTRDMDSWTENGKSILDQVSKTRDTLKLKLKNDWTEISCRNIAIQTSTKAVHEETIRIVDAQLKDMATQMAALDQFVTRARSQNERNHAKYDQSLDEISGNVQQSFQSLEQRLTSASESLQTHLTESSISCSALQNSVGTLANHVQEPLAEISSKIRAAALQEYTHTGETPQKCEWDYPTTLPHTEGRDKLITRLRGLPDPKKQAVRSNSRTPGRSPRKIASPRKSPSKLPSPSKTKVYSDVSSDRVLSVPPASAVFTPNGGSKSGLRELDMNIAAGRPAPTEGHNEPSSSFSKSVNSVVQHPPLKRHATAVDGSKLPLKAAGARGKLAEGRENVNVLSQSTGAGNGRRLRSSPPQ